jgi:hypothetical protein
LETIIHTFVKRDKINSYTRNKTENFLIEKLKKSQEYPLAITLNEKGEDGGS